MSVITIERKVLEKNEDIASLNRESFKQKNLFVIDMLSSPGSGKTSILETTLAAIADQIGIAVIEGDVQTDNDAQRIAKHNVPVVQIAAYQQGESVLACHDPPCGRRDLGDDRRDVDDEWILDIVSQRANVGARHRAVAKHGRSAH